MEDLRARQGDRKDRLGAHRVLRSSANEATYEGESGQLDAGDRWPACSSGIRCDRAARRLGHERQRAVASRRRCSQQRLVSRSQLSVGSFELADHLHEFRDPPGRYPKWLLHRCVGPRTGKQIWRTARVDEIPTWGTPSILTSASGRSELVTNGTKIRGYDPGNGQAAVDLRTELGNHRRHSGVAATVSCS